MNAEEHAYNEEIFLKVCKALGLDPNDGDTDSADCADWIVAAIRAKEAKKAQWFEPKVNAHITLSGAVRAVDQLQPVVDAVNRALNETCADAHVNWNLWASTEVTINKKRQKNR